ncbi:MAG: HAD family hydrolase [Anaerolineaceae bacterium]
MIRGIFFDAAGVLYQRNAPTASYALRLLQEGTFSTQINESDSQKLEELRVNASQGFASYESYWHQFLLYHGVQNSEQRARMIIQITTFSNDVQKVEGCREALVVLKERKFIMGIISDTIYPLEWKMQRLAKAGVADLIDLIACSTDLGMHKPDPAFYRYAMEQAQLPPEQSAFVGHDAKELSGARQAGMLTVAVNYEEKVKADHYCQTMMDLLTIPEFAAPKEMVGI